MELTKEQLLKDGNWWLITTQYPVACTAAIYRVVQSDKDPVENMPQDEWSELVDKVSEGVLQRFVEIACAGMGEYEQLDYCETHGEFVDKYVINI